LEPQSPGFRRPKDLPLLIAAVGSLVLAVPGLVGFLVLAWVSFGMSWPPDVRSLVTRPLLPALPLLGFYLLYGYWRAVRRASPARHPRFFWWASAGYNVVGLALASTAAVVEARTGMSGVLLAYSVPLICWTTFMTWFSVSRARMPHATGPQ
jgi:hypothetical protein